jgi:hypothetical protein
MSYTILHRDDIREGVGSYEFEGYLHGDSNVSFIWIDLPPGAGPKLHKRPYEEIFHRPGRPPALHRWRGDTRGAAGADHRRSAGDAAQVRQHRRRTIAADRYPRQQAVHHRVARRVKGRVIANFHGLLGTNMRTFALRTVAEVPTPIVEDQVAQSEEVRVLEESYTDAESSRQV